MMPTIYVHRLAPSNAEQFGVFINNYCRTTRPFVGLLTLLIIVHIHFRIYATYMYMTLYCVGLPTLFVSDYPTVCWTNFVGLPTLIDSLPIGLLRDFLT